MQAKAGESRGSLLTRHSAGPLTAHLGYWVFLLGLQNTCERRNAAGSSCPMGREQSPLSSTLSGFPGMPRRAGSPPSRPGQARPGSRPAGERGRVWGAHRHGLPLPRRAAAVLPQGSPQGVPALLSRGEPQRDIRAAIVRSELAVRRALWCARRGPRAAVWLLPWAGVLLLGAALDCCRRSCFCPGSQTAGAEGEELSREPAFAQRWQEERPPEEDAEGPPKSPWRMRLTNSRQGRQRGPAAAR